MSLFDLESCIISPTIAMSCLDHIFVCFHKSNLVSFVTSIVDLKLTDHCLTHIQISYSVGKVGRTIFGVNYKIDFRFKT